MTSSVDIKNSRYVNGGSTEVSPGRVEWWERKTFTQSSTDDIYLVQPVFAGRLDKIADAFYDDSRLWWIIAQYNNILDPLTEIVPGKELFIPKKSRLYTDFLNGKTGGVPTTRVLKQTIKPVV